MSTHNKPAVPFEKSQSLKGIDNIVVKGIVPNGSQRFNVNLQRGGGANAEDVPLHVDVRFNYGSDKNIMVFNDRKGGKWRSEERNAKTFPFAYGQRFKLKIRIQKDQYKIQIGDHDVKDFNHRQPVHDVDTLRIDGNVQLDEVKIETILN
ncbi:hypothetical protein ACJMK2_037661 [Sinanodonta woodiana]|uniref:Galectin n=1 Tax=Sinanodonta woodiana TaxID=1069815 RepID=A0ABD3WL43_SINWO